MVVTAGGLVAIENIQPGDVVLAANEETGEVAYKEVVRTFVNTTDEITHVTIENAEGEQETIVTESNTNRIITGFPGNASKYDP